MSETGDITQKVEACPECGSSMINSRMTMTPTYKCSSCKNEFDEPVVRKAKKGTDGDWSNVAKAHRESIMRELKRLSDNGVNYVKSKDVSDNIDHISTQATGQAMRLLEDEGVLELWGSRDNGATWRILI